MQRPDRGLTPSTCWLSLAALLVACSADATHDDDTSSASGGVGAGDSSHAASTSGAGGATTSASGGTDAVGGSMTSGGGGASAGGGGTTSGGGGESAGGGTAAGGGGATSGGGGGSGTSCDWLPGTITYALDYHENVAHSFIDDDCDLWIGSPYSGAVWRIPHADPGNPQLWANLLSNHPHGLARDPASGRIFAASAHGDGAKIWEIPATAPGPATDLGATGLPPIPNGMRVAPPGWGTHGGRLIVAFTDGTIAAVDPTTADTTTLVATGDLLSGLVFDGLTLYAGNQADGTIITVTPQGTAVPFTVLPCPVAGITVDPGQRLFAGCAFTGELFQVALSDAAVTQIGTANSDLGWYPRLLQWDGSDSLIIADGQLFWFTFIEL